jgi:hypothetical protein
MMHDISIGLVVYDEVVCACVRVNDELRSPILHRVDDGNAAAAILLDLKSAPNLRHDLPTVYVAPTTWSPAVLRVLRQQDTKGFYNTVVFEAEALSAPAGLRFHDRWSEIVFRFHEQIENGDLHVAAADELVDELAAFEPVAGGKTRFADPLTAERKLGRYPVRGVAATLAMLPGNT